MIRGDDPTKATVTTAVSSSSQAETGGGLRAAGDITLLAGHDLTCT